MAEEEVSPEQVDDILYEFIAFLNSQKGAHADAMAGFAGHVTRVGRQVHRIQKATRSKDGVIVATSFEDASKPDIVINRVMRAEDYLAQNRRGGANEQQYARAILIFLYVYWEDEIRPRLAQARSMPLNDISSDLMGDLRLVRHAILHSRGILRADKHKAMRKLEGLFQVDQPIKPGLQEMHTIFKFAKQECARIMFEWKGDKDAAAKAADLKDFAIQRLGRRRK